jgi:quercetin dioxygenase-like cupin family protein
MTLTAVSLTDGQAQESDDGTTESLLQQTVDALPEAPAAIELARMTLAPGAGREMVVPGPELYAVESGSLGVRVDGPAFLTRAATGGEPSAPEEMEPGVDYVLQPGDQAMVLTRVAHQLINDGQEPVTFLNVVIYEQDAALPSWLPEAVLPEGVGITPIAADVIIDEGVLPKGRADVAVERVTIAVGDDLPAEITDGLALIVVEDGVLSVTYEQGATSTPIATPDATPAATPASAATPTSAGPLSGDRVAGEVVRVSPGMGFSAGNGGDAPLSVIALVISASESA